MGLLLMFCTAFILFLSAIPRLVLAKECTNTPTPLSSHTLRSAFLSTQKREEKPHSHDHLILPNPGGDLDWVMLQKKMKNLGSDGLKTNWNGGNFLKEVSLHDVRLDPESIQGQAGQTNLEYLLLLDVDSLVWSFRKTAGLDTPGSPYGGWEDPGVELRGHFVGHYMSASAHMWASTHNQTLQAKMSEVVSALDACQKKLGTGYLSGFPSELFDRFEAVQPVWAPYYTIHKIMAGLLDQYTFAGNDQALQMVVWMADYFSNRVKNVIVKYSLERHWMSLNEETGGMNDVLYKLYRITGDQKHLILAHLFDKPCFLGLLAVQADSISGFHANTHIPVVIGSQMRYEVTGDTLYKAISTFFMDIVNSSHSYATGGTSVGEFWPDPKRLGDTLQTENQESCTTYNMLKVSRNLFRWTKEIAYADYYERALTNGVLGIQRGREPGVMIYMLPQGRGVSKARSYHGWGTKFKSFWCCYGTGIESFSKLGDSIYFEEEGDVPGLYIIQFISSSLSWRSTGIVLKQKVEPVVSSDPYLRVSFTFSTVGVDKPSTLYLRIPVWTYLDGAKATLNGQTLSLPSPGNFLSITRKWDSSDNLTLKLPIILRTETIKDDRPKYSSLQAFLFGPYLLVGLTDGDWDMKTGTSKSLPFRAIPATYNSQLVTLTQEVNDTILVLTNSKNSITMERLPTSGTDAAVHATFRVIGVDSNLSSKVHISDIIGKSIILEPFDLPESVVQNGQNNSLVVMTARGKPEPDGDKESSVFRVVAGLDGKPGSVSFELESKRGCFMYTGVDYNAGESVHLSCQSELVLSDDKFRRAVSFTFSSGMSEYHAVSFVAEGERRNFLMMPLLNLRDESYTVYFNVTASSNQVFSRTTHASQVI